MLVAKAAVQILVAVVAVVAFGSPAFARKANTRSGVNFGTSVRVMDTDERTAERNGKSSSSSAAVNPFVGYAWDDFNLGLALASENKETESREDAADGLSTTHRKQMLTSKGASIFLRYLFGNVFFFEVAGGAYQERLEVESETTHPESDTTFTGEKDKYAVNGVGPGYHVGAGLELPMGGGFFFTSAYQLRMVQLRAPTSGSELGKKRSQEQKREVLFGIEYYAH